MGINRGYLAGSWIATSKGICSSTFDRTDLSSANSYYGESQISSGSGNINDEFKQSSDNVYIETKDEHSNSYDLYLGRNNYRVQLLSFHLPNKIGRSIGSWPDTDEPKFSFQRIVAGKSRDPEDKRFSYLGAREYAWELLDDGSMYARRAVISTNRRKFDDGSTVGIYLGPEGFAVGNKFAIRKDGSIIKGISNYHITKIEYSGTTKVKFYFQSNVDSSKTYYQNFTISRDSEERITALTASSSGNYLPSDYSFNTITVTY